MKKIYGIMGNYQLKNNEVIEYIEKADKPFKYTHGIGYRSPTIHKVDVTKERAIEIWEDNSLCDIEEYDEYIHINTFSSNDLW